MGNPEWNNLFPMSETEFLELAESDHRPLITFISDVVEDRRGCFRYDHRMKDKEGFNEAVLEGWKKRSSNQNSISLAQNIEDCRKSISKWKKNNKQNSEEKIAVIRAKLDKGITDGTLSLMEKHKLREDLNRAYVEEEAFWKQKSRLPYVKEGERNTKYFHSIVKTRQKRNRINAITDENGVIRRGDKEIVQVAENYFTNLFTSSDCQQHFASVFEGFQRRVSQEMNEDLTKPVTDEEIKKAVFDIGPHKAPGPDGFTGVFYRQFWEEIQEEVYTEVKCFFEEMMFDPSQNQTNICLIPKVHTPASMAEFRPISLCNVSYKIISKILVNRLKSHLSGIISENQAAFIPGRMISDNILVAHEVFHSLKVRKRQANSYMAIKTDITKAYDRLEWKFLEETMRQMGFAEKWISWVMVCITTVEYAVKLNGKAQGHILPHRGIRQGDPLSPYLFILCAEVLSHLMDREVLNRGIQGVKLSNSGPVISHLLFADDSLFFSLANVKSCRNIKKVWSLYEAASGQSVNLNKSALTFGSKVKRAVKRKMRRILGIHNDGGGGKYLGIPEQTAKKKKEMFKHVVEKVKATTQGWNKRFLSHGGKEVLLKSVATAMPIYNMSIFKFTKEVCDEINSVFASYWWSKGGEKRGKHWFAWKRLCVPKKEGGMGFKDLESFNLALLGKQAWRILQNPQSMVARMYKDRYYREENIITARKGKQPSYAWKSILHGRDILKQGLRCVIGNGDCIGVWTDPWIPDNPPRAPRPRDLNSPNVRLCEWLTADRTEWNVEMVQSLVADEDIDKVLSLKLGNKEASDLLGWHFNDNGIYTVKSAYWFITHYLQDSQVPPIPGNTELKKKIWRLKTASKVQHLVWKLLSGSLATGENLRRRHISRDSICKRCFQEEEDLNHLFFKCDYAKSLWRASGISNAILYDDAASVEDKIEVILDCNIQATLSHQSQLPLWILWRIWKCRNVLIYDKQSIPWTQSLKLAKADALEWKVVEVYHQSNSSPMVGLSVRQSTQHWTKPDKAWVKCNYDAGFINSDLSATAGWLVRDEFGRFLGAAKAKGNRTSSVLVSELQSLVMAMQHCWTRGFTRIVFEGDNQTVVKLVNGTKQSFANHNWIRQIHSWARKFSEVKFQWIGRDANKPADILAKNPLSDGCTFQSFFYVPQCITNALHMDYVSATSH